VQKGENVMLWLIRKGPRTDPWGTPELMNADRGTGHCR